ncbi:50S ribosomal protein L11 methyltransferase [Hyphomonas sp.]|jgi:ribosomal protein L11 methyltransferase|uniref:50S ribosomal protein L11 methyltransferase n=1 Tax=Hyphomonas sp. TaxID=87 RepID=UPI000C5868A4|nr:50S ribosomal protein L11 methyltransferase [Hyphomonas sp.]MAB09552.1 50S ribosomal protein L11 methyltransferase [Hyphomonas sp.]MAU66345.1 50S ribosomal protein L11 methyltransferase [Hyphomonas sp.]MBM59632.1 50S ribosomal protein L11 methyltransferase [Hyphomonas sp.]
MYQISARGARAPVEAAWDALAWADPSPAGAVDCKEDGRGIWRLDAFAETQDEADECVALIAETSPELNARVEEVIERDWVTMSLEGLPPVSAGPFFVAGSHAIARHAPGKIAVLIEAGPAFGTGHHGTTLGCLLALDGVRRRRAIGKVLDLGTGSGVLAIAALKAGASMALGTDIDFDSVPVANENAKKNNVTGFTAMHVTGARHPRIRQAAPYDTVFANILMKPLIGLAPEIARLTAPGGTIILSGLLHHQAMQVRQAFEGHGILFERRIRKDGWSTLVMRQPG